MSIQLDTPHFLKSDSEIHKIKTVGIIVFFIAGVLIGNIIEYKNAIVWFLLATTQWLYIISYSKKNLHLNKFDQTSCLYPNLGLGTQLTLLRGGLIAIVGGTVFVNSEASNIQYLAAISYTLTALLDRLDGLMARRTNQVSLLGAQLDITIDALGLLVAPLVAYSEGKIHWSYLILSVAYYVYQYGIQRLKNKQRDLKALPENHLKRTLAGFQMAFIAICLWPVLDPNWTRIISIAFMLPVLFGFIIDWYIINEKIQVNIINNLFVFNENIFLPLLRFCTLILTYIYFQEIDVNDRIFIIIPAILIAVGFAGRILSFLLIIAICESIIIFPQPISIVLIFILSWILLLGTGRYSLWKPFDLWIKSYDS